MASTSYDEVPYDGGARYHTHPDRLATIAKLAGMTPAPVERCRVLEIGCGVGGNLVPMALRLPDARFVGVDFSQRQIETARTLSNNLALTNIEWRACDIREIGPEIGAFDYILCHGVFSWVPEAVRDHILELCKQCLSPMGVAYISYNTYPGWHLRGMVREMVKYHAQRFDDPSVRVPQSRAFLDYLARSLPQPDSAFAHVLRDEQERWKEVADYYLFHEHLEDENQPLYFHEFARRAADRGLQYLGEAWQHSHANDLTPEAAQVLQNLAGDLIQREQYLDFLRNRTFRRSLLVRSDVALDRNTRSEAVRGLLVSALAQPVEAPPGAAADQIHFRTEEGVELASNSPLVTALLQVLYQTSPRALRFDDVVARMIAMLPESEAMEVQRHVAEALPQFFFTGLAGLHTYFPQFAATAGERPLADPLARMQAEATAGVTNLRHGTVKPPDLDRNLLALLDGKRDRAALLRELLKAVENGKLTIALEGRTIVDAQEREEIMAKALEESLSRLAKAALLLA